jgi:hypothetical protein
MEVDLAETMQMEDRNKQTLRQDLQDERDRLPFQEQSPKGEASCRMPICFSILLILSNFDDLNS